LVNTLANNLHTANRSLHRRGRFRKSKAQEFIKWLRVQACLLRVALTGQPPPQITEQQQNYIRQWAEGITQICEVRLIGSRAMG
jgi:hypothetical protein